MSEETNAAQRAVDAAVGFENSIRQSLNYYMGEGLSVTQGVGVLALMKTEIEMSYFLKHEEFKDVIREAVFDTKIGGERR